jgi:hypothetical protein
MQNSNDKFEYRDEAERLIKTHQREAEESFEHFRESLVSDLQRDLKAI